MRPQKVDHETAAVPESEVIVVLGARVLEGGLPSVALQRRVRHAVKLIQKGDAKWLLFSGGTGRHPPSEASVMKRLAQSYGISVNQIILDETATSTMQNAAACARIMQSHGWLTAMIVTDGYHLKRSLLAFRHFGIAAVGNSPKDKNHGQVGWRWWYLRARELFALLWYLIWIKLERLRQTINGIRQFFT